MSSPRTAIENESQHSVQTGLKKVSRWLLSNEMAQRDKAKAPRCSFTGKRKVTRSVNGIDKESTGNSGINPVDDYVIVIIIGVTQLNCRLWQYGLSLCIPRVPFLIYCTFLFLAQAIHWHFSLVHKPIIRSLTRLSPWRFMWKALRLTGKRLPT